ncbi:MAG: hypothetical protein WBA22_07560 [Candidatus Methanofastidiosia archaeon]
MSENLDDEIEEYQKKAENSLENLALSINLYLVQQGIIENLVQQEVFKRAAEQVSVQQEVFKRAAQQVLISSFLPALDFREILDSFSHLTVPEFMEEDEWKKFEYNWLGFLTVSELRVLYEEWKNGKDDIIRDFFFRMFDDKEKVERLMEKLSGNVLFDSRMHIISDALDSHVSGKYSLSIPILIAQIDGIFIEAHKDVLKNEKGKSVDYCKECGHPYPVSPNAKRISKKLEELNDHFTYIPGFLRFIEKEYNDRSKILHGLSKDYPCRDHSTKLILALYELRQALGRSE